MMSWPTADGDIDGNSVSNSLSMAGMPSRDEMLDCYETISGRSTEDIDYYIILARFKLGIVLEQGYSRFLAGAGVNPKVEAFGPLVLDLIRKAADLAAKTPCSDPPCPPSSETPSTQRPWAPPSCTGNAKDSVPG